jgi:uncharacterized protein YlxW (UPF0749 family)
VGLCLGLLLQIQVRTPADSAEDSRYEQAQVGAAIQQLEEDQLDLKDAIGRLRSRLERYQQESASQTETLREIRDELTGQRMRAGLVALEGSGLIVSLEDSEAAPLSADADANPYIIHEYDLRDVVHLLWLAGAEAVAINDERVVVTTSIYCVGSTIMVNDTRLSPPYRVQAIGNPEALHAMATDSAYLGSLRRRAREHGVGLAVDWSEEVALPAYQGSFTFEYAQAGG